jgi:small-conductance mechanosensitive channel
VKLSAVIATVIRGILLIFFLVQALQVLNLEVLNTVGTAIIAYLPSLISSGLILAVALIGGNILSSFLKEVTGSTAVANAVRYGLLILAVFMALDQLKFAQTIVQSTFTIVLGAAAVAFALAFGLGGRDWAAKQLEKLDKK